MGAETSATAAGVGTNSQADLTNSTFAGGVGNLLSCPLPFGKNRSAENHVDGGGNCHLPTRSDFPSFAVVNGYLHAVTAWILGAALVCAAEAPKSLSWEALKVGKSIFTPALGMLDSEREEYATNLATIAVNQIVAAKASPQSLADSRRMLALALQLSPRNKRAVVANYQLSKNLIPEATESNYSPQVFARLLLIRGQLLEKQMEDENKRLAAMFINLAASLDPKNEDAVYASEVHRLDQGPVDWAAITGEPEKKPENSEKKPGTGGNDGHGD